MKSPCAVLAVLALAAPAWSLDGGAAAARMGLLLEQAGLPEARVGLSRALSAPSATPCPTPASLFPDDLWDRMSPPPATVLARLVLRDPALRASEVRELPFDQADALMAKAAANGLTGLDVFSDPGLRYTRVYYFSPETLGRLFKKYDLRSLNLPEGRDVHGRPFRMDGILAGGGRIVMFYDRDKFHFSNPYYTDFHYQAESTVVYTIVGDGELAVQGLKIDATLIHPRITRVRKTGPDRMRVETTWGDRDKPLWAIRLRPDYATASNP